MMTAFDTHTLHIRHSVREQEWQLRSGSLGQAPSITKATHLVIQFWPHTHSTCRSKLQALQSISHVTKNDDSRIRKPDCAWGSRRPATTLLQTINRTDSIHAVWSSAIRQDPRGVNAAAAQLQLPPVGRRAQELPSSKKRTPHLTLAL